MNFCIKATIDFHAHVSLILLFQEQVSSGFRSLGKEEGPHVSITNFKMNRVMPRSTIMKTQQ